MDEAQFQRFVERLALSIVRARAPKDQGARLATDLERRVAAARAVEPADGKGAA